MPQLSEEMLNLIHNGAGPIRLHDRGRYYDLVAIELRKIPLLSNGNVVDAIATRTAVAAGRGVTRGTLFA
jgi:hypothetical protein